MSVDKMSVDKMFVDEMFVDKMSEDEITFDKMTCFLKITNYGPRKKEGKKRGTLKKLQQIKANHTTS